MKKILFLGIALAMYSCSSTNHVTAQDDGIVTGATAEKYAETITSEELKTHLYIIAGDEYEGRDTGQPGQKKAAEYLKNFYVQNNIKSPLGGDDYYQEIPTEHLRPNLNPSENVLAFIEGSEKPEEIVVISAHYDHVGMRNGIVYNGADDDGSGTVAIMEIAQAFKEAAKNGNGPKRSILFLHVTGEERGLLGSKFYVNFPVFPIGNHVANLNIDMIGRIDEAHEDNADYIYLIGSDKLSTDLHNLSEQMNSKFTKLFLDYKYNDDNDPNRFYYRSDHYNFAKNNIPVIFYFNGTHQDYHRPSDTPDKIDYQLLEKRAKLIYYTAWEVANRPQRVVVDK